MTKKHFIELADTIREANCEMPPDYDSPFSEDVIIRLADFCESQNPRFKRSRWIGYILGTNGKNGGKVKL